MKGKYLGETIDDVKKGKVYKLEPHWSSADLYAVSTKDRNKEKGNRIGIFKSDFKIVLDIKETISDIIKRFKNES